jgi:hypothetical protein
MTSNEFEERKRQLEEHHRAGIELLEAAHRRQVRALEIVYLTAASDEVQIPSPEAPAAEAPSTVTTVTTATTVTPPAFSRRGPGELREEIRAALSRIPQVFDRHDICRALGEEPDRSSLFRALRELVAEGVLAVEEVGRGKVAGTYRQ